MNKIFFAFIFLFSLNVLAQTGELRGVIKDESTDETLIGATVLADNGKGAVTDINGAFSLKLDPGTYNITISYIGYEAKKQKVTIGEGPVTLNLSLTTKTLNEVEVVANIATVRETPVAITNISVQKIQEELGSRDLPMILNSTPGVYATEQGGGAGDARITIRGFDQRNIAVLVDGVPVNDMENGQVFWSNWDGLGEITKNLQVQRGLGASKLAVASVGGTMNTITKGIDSKMGGVVKQEVGNNGMFKTTVSYTTGLMKNGFGVTLSASRKTGDGWVDQTWFESYSYFLKIQKNVGNHLISVGVNGAPQKHGQRTTRLPIAVLDRDFANKLMGGPSGYKDSAVINGVKVYTPISIADSTILTSEYTGFTRGGIRVTNGSLGRRYNPGWGYISQYEKEDGVFERSVAPFNPVVNYYHKPLFNLSDHWNVNEKLFISNVAYLSVGTGGGTALNTAITRRDTADGQIDMQKDFEENQKNIQKKYSETETFSSRYVRSSNNDHTWYGILSTAIYKFNSALTLTGGVDARHYEGRHYRTVYDLFGGDYTTNFANTNQPKELYSGDPNRLNVIRRVGDTIDRNYFSTIKWYGLFTQGEYRTGRWTAFMTLTGSQTSYQRTDNYAKRDIVLSDTTFTTIVGFGDTLAYDGNKYVVYNRGTKRYTSNDSIYYTTNKGVVGLKSPTLYNNTSQESRTATTNKKWFTGYTLKAGFNFKVTEHHNIYVNGGVISVAPRFDNVFDVYNREFKEINNQMIYAAEVGYGVGYRKIAVNLNAYYTLWMNKPPAFAPSIFDPITESYISYNINGIDALHKGIELDFSYRPFTDLSIKQISSIEWQGTVSVGDWRYISAETAFVYDNNGDPLDTVVFSAVDVHVGDAAQLQLGSSLKFNIIKNLYLKGQYTYFGNQYANFDPSNLRGVNENRESWKMPDYGLLDMFAGYEFKYHDLRFNLNAGVINALNTSYISDAQNGASFDARTALVYFGQGRRFNTSLRISF